MTERLAPCNGIEIAYETFGDPGDPAVLLIMGLGSQMIVWDARFCGLLAAHGYHVIRFDNRDSGHSSKIEGGPKPNPGAALFGSTRSASYALEDMAADALSLLDHLGIKSAHLVGASMGGAIAQSIVIHHPDRVLSLCSMMSPTGRIWAEFPSLRLLRELMNARATDRAGYIEEFVTLFRTQGSPGYPFDETWTRSVAEASFDRGVDHVATDRQSVAVFSSINRRPALHGVRAPTLVIHGTADRLVPPRAGRYAARAIRGARLMEIPGMGHDFPPVLWQRIADAIADNAARAGATARRINPLTAE
jgi:pimeloyl-ACP methyl ester carboxylesterase